MRIVFPELPRACRYEPHRSQFHLYSHRKTVLVCLYTNEIVHIVSVRLDCPVMNKTLKLVCPYCICKFPQMSM